MTKEVATIILNRNLPKVTDRLVSHLKTYDENETDIFVVEAGSDPNNLSNSTTWYANSDEIIKNGLRYARGMNYGLLKLVEEGIFENYNAFFLLTNDTEFENKASIRKLLDVLKDHPRMGILSPCGKNWGERHLLTKVDTKYFWFIHNNAYLLRKEFIKDICIYDNYLNFLFDGTNFRGYGLEHELIAKAYVNDWGAAITSRVISSENESYLLNKADLIKTESFEENIELYIKEGKLWMKQKYGFNSPWAMQQYSKAFYEHFFTLHPELSYYCI